MMGQENYHMETLELYNPDTNEKWQKIMPFFEGLDQIKKKFGMTGIPLHSDFLIEFF